VALIESPVEDWLTRMSKMQPVDDFQKQVQTRCNILHHTATHCIILQDTARHYKILQTQMCKMQLVADIWDIGTQNARHCHTLLHTATCCSTIQDNAAQCNSRMNQMQPVDDLQAWVLRLQHSAILCDTLQQPE